MTPFEVVRSEFWARVDTRGVDDCWEWKLSTGSHGYGQWWPRRQKNQPASVFNRNWVTHRMAWYITRGPIPPSWTIDHECRNRRCCNPRHLRLMTNSQNAGQNGAWLATHCPRGHTYNEANTYLVPSTGHRQCRSCRPIHKAAMRARQQAA